MKVSELLVLFPEVNLFRIYLDTSCLPNYKKRNEIEDDFREVVYLDVDCSRELLVYVR